MVFDPRNLIRPVGPGLPGSMNPLAFIGAGMATGDMGSQLARMGQLQMTAEQLGMQQQEIERKRKQQEAMSAVAPGVAQQLYPGNTAMQQLMAANPQLLAQVVQAQMKTPSPTSAEKIYTAMGGQAGTGKTFADWYASDFKGAGTTVNVGGVGDLGAVPSAMARVEDPTSPTGTRLVQEPGATEDIKRQSGLQALEGMLADMTELESLVKQHGTEAFGDTSRRMTILRNRYIGNISNLRQTGVLQEGELKRLEEEIPDPTSWTKSGVQVLPGIRGAREEVKRKLDGLRSLYGDAGPGGPTAPAAPAAPAAAGGPAGFNLPPGWKVEKVR